MMRVPTTPDESQVPWYDVCTLKSDFASHHQSHSLEGQSLLLWIWSFSSVYFPHYVVVVPVPCKTVLTAAAPASSRYLQDSVNMCCPFLYVFYLAVSLILFRGPYSQICVQMILSLYFLTLWNLSSRSGDLVLKLFNALAISLEASSASAKL